MYTPTPATFSVVKIIARLAFPLYNFCNSLLNNPRGFINLYTTIFKLRRI
jgi:hypothetical protein